MELSDLRAKSKDKIKSHWRLRLHEIIFEADTAAGKAFDIILLILILSSVTAVMLESVASIEAEYGLLLRGLEWLFTILFTIEYLARIITIGKPVKYIFSFLGIIDLLAIIPTYISFFVTGTQFLLVFRTFRLLQIGRASCRERV